MKAHDFSRAEKPKANEGLEPLREVFALHKPRMSYLRIKLQFARTRRTHVMNDFSHDPAQQDEESTTPASTLSRAKQEDNDKLAALRSAIQAGEESGIAEGDVIAEARRRVRLSGL